MPLRVQCVLNLRRSGETGSGSGGRSKGDRANSRLAHSRSNCMPRNSTRLTQTGFDPFSAVLAFHGHFGLGIGERPAPPAPEIVVLRRRLITEELVELDAALTSGDSVQVADALADLLYVTYSAAVSSGIEPLLAGMRLRIWGQPE